MESFIGGNNEWMGMLRLLIEEMGRRKIEMVK